MILSPDAVLKVIDSLNVIGAPYIVTGSLARNVYSTPRSTLDADFVVEMDSQQLSTFFAMLNADFRRDPQTAFETVTGKTQHKLCFRKSNFLIEIFEADPSDPHERSRFERRRAGEMEGRTAFIPTAEDVIVQKLRWFKQIRRTKDRDDARDVMVHQWNVLDWSYIERWCQEHQTLFLLEEIKRQVLKKLNE